MTCLLQFSMNEIEKRVKLISSNSNNYIMLRFFFPWRSYTQVINFYFLQAKEEASEAEVEEKVTIDVM